MIKSGNLKSSADAEFDTIKARCFHLIGSDGSVSATFDARHDSTPVLTLFGDGLSRLVLTVQEGRPHINLMNPDGVSMVSISATQNGEFGLSLRRADNSEAASILVDINKEAAISVFDRNGKQVHKLSSDAP